MRHMRHIDPADHAVFDRFLCAKRGPEAQNYVFHVSHVHRGRERWDRALANVRAEYAIEATR